MVNHFTSEGKKINTINGYIIPTDSTVYDIVVNMYKENHEKEKKKKQTLYAGADCGPATAQTVSA